FLRPCLVNDLHHGEVVIDPPLGIRNLEDHAVTAGAIVCALRQRSRRGAAVAQGPFVARDLTRGAPRACAVQHHLFPYRGEVVRPRSRHELRRVFPLVGLPEEGVSLQDTPFARRLPALDVKMEMRPAAAAPLLAEYAQLLSHLDPLPRADRG